MGKIKIKIIALLNFCIVVLALTYISKQAMQQIQVDFFIKYPELNPANGRPPELTRSLSKFTDYSAYTIVYSVETKDAS